MAKKKKNRRIPPKCKALLICQGIITEAETNTISIIKIFDNFNLRQFPEVTSSFVVFAQLVGGIGCYHTWIEVQDLESEMVILRSEGIVEFDDRVRAQNIMIPIPPITLQHPGVYDIVLLADGLEIDRQQLIVTQEEGPTSGIPG